MADDHRMAERIAAEALQHHHLEHGVCLDVDGQQYCGVLTNLSCDPDSGFTDLPLDGGEILHVPSSSEVSVY